MADDQNRPSSAAGNGGLPANRIKGPCRVAVPRKLPPDNSAALCGCGRGTPCGTGDKQIAAADQCPGVTLCRRRDRLPGAQLGCYPLRHRWDGLQAKSCVWRLSSDTARSQPCRQTTSSAPPACRRRKRHRPTAVERWSARAAGCRRPHAHRYQHAARSQAALSRCTCRRARVARATDRSSSLVAGSLCR